MSKETIQVDALESEAIYIFREVVAQFEKPVLLFSGGKDSITLVRLAQKAFYPAKIPFPLMHIDTGHNFPETIEFRDRLVKELDVDLIVRNVQDNIDSGRVKEETGRYASRNMLQTETLLDAIEEFGFDACIGGARRDEEKARAKERIFSVRDGLICSADDKVVYRDEEEEVEERMVRFRTVGDMSCTAAVLSEAIDIAKVVEEIRDSTISERGARIDDKRSEAAMEKRKQQGYF